MNEWVLPGFVWVNIQSPTMNVDRCPEVFDVPESPSGFLHPLDAGVDGLQAGIGEPVLEVGHDVREAALIAYQAPSVA